MLWNRHRSLTAFAVLALAATLCIAPEVGAAPQQVPAETNALTPAGPVGSVYVPLVPCRVLDSRFGGGGKFASQDQRDYSVAGSGPAFAGQGGTAGGCGVPADAVAVEASVTATAPANGGYFRAWPTGSPAPTATFLNYTRNQGTTNTGAITLGTAGQVTVKNFGGPAHYVIDIQGYFADPTTTGALYVPLTPCRVLDTRFGGGGKLASQDQRSYQTAGTGPNFAAQGGQPGGCGVPDGAQAIEASVTAAAPANGGYFRAWPTGEPQPNATFINFSKNQGTTNTGAITLAPTGTDNLTIKNFGGPAHYVIDIQGYFTNATDLPPLVQGAVYVPGEPCRVLDTRFGGGGKLASQDQRNYQAAGTGANFTTQGGQANGCDIPDGAAAIEASVTATAPANGGYFRAWPTGTTPPTATFLNYTANQGTTNTGAITLAASGTNDLTIKNFGGPAHYVIDTQGHYQTINTTRITDGDGSSTGQSTSDDGRYVAFTSSASNLVPGDTNSAVDVFVWDHTTGATTRITDGSESDNSFSPAISGDGRHVTFGSSASDLVLGDTNGQDDIFTWDRTTGITARITDGNGYSVDPAISNDGRHITFTSGATDLAPGDTNGQEDVFTWDRTTGTTIAVTDGNSYSVEPAISSDGRHITFISGASNLVPGDTNGQQDVFTWDRTTGTTTRITDGNGSSRSPAIDGAGRHITFSSEASNLVGGDTNGREDIFTWDRTTSTTTAVTQANSDSGFPSISADGRHIAFGSFATDLAPGDTNGEFDVFAWDRSTGTTTRITAGNASTFSPVISGDGLTVVYPSQATDHIPGDTSNAINIFVSKRT